MLAALEWARVAAAGEAPEAALELGYSLWRAGRGEEALGLLGQIGGDPAGSTPARAHADCLRVVIHLTDARFAEAGALAETLLDAPGVPPVLHEDLRKTTAAAHLVAGDRAAALRRLDLARPAEATIAEEMSRRPRGQKSPALAGSLSALLPGAGQAYCGRWRDASIALLVNALLVGTAVEAYDHDRPWLGTTTAVFGAGWYLGNIYSAVNSAHKHNETRRARRVLDWLGRLEVGLGEKSVRAAFRFEF